VPVTFVIVTLLTDCGPAVAAS